MLSPAEAFPKAWPWIAGLIGLAGLLLVFLPQHIAAGIIIAIALIIIMGIFRWFDGAVFTLLSVEKVLEVHDANGARATLTRHMTARVNHKGVTEFWCRNISADGNISNLKIDGAAPFEEKREAGDRQVCKRFNQPLKRHEQFEMALSYDLADSFPAPTEGLIHVVESPTKRLRLVVILPEGRKARAARMLLRFGGQVHKELNKPTIKGRRIEFETAWLKLGEEYCLEWDW